MKRPLWHEFVLITVFFLNVFLSVLFLMLSKRSGWSMSSGVTRMCVLT